jgi:HEAT repeat protein
MRLILSFLLYTIILSACGQAKKNMEITEIKLDDLEPLELNIPDYEPMNCPYSEWQANREMQLLEANGYADCKNRSEWLNAASDKVFLLRIAAYYLLSQEPKSEEMEYYRKGLTDLDNTVQAYAAYALVRLGDSTQLAKIQRIAAIDDGVSLEVYPAAGVLGELGKAEAFEVLRKGLKSTNDVQQLLAIHQSYHFFKLWDELDLTKFYHKALSHPSERVRLIARLQLEELDTEAAKSLLDH